jgi:hypothetical protein
MKETPLKRGESVETDMDIGSAEAVGAESAGVQRFLGLVSAGGSLEEKRDLYETALTLGPEEIVAALKIAERLPNEKNWAATELLLQRWAELDAPAAAAYVLAQGDKLSTWSPVMGAWVKSDRDAALQWAQGLPPGQARVRVLFAYARALAPLDSRALISVLDLLPEKGSHSDILELAYREYAHRNPQAAANETLSLPAGPQRKKAVDSVLQMWTGSNPQAALEWSMALADKTVRLEAMRSAVYSWCWRDPEGALTAAQALPPGLDRETLLDSISYTILKNTPPEVALDFLRQQPPSEYSQGLATIAEVLAEKDVPAALAFVGKSALPGENYALRQVLSVWGRQDPKAAAEYALKHFHTSEGESRPEPGIVSDWADYDLEQAMSWAETVQDAGVRRQVFEALVSRLSNFDPPRAVPLLANVPEEERGRLMGIIAAQWVSSDAEAAKAWAGALPEGKEKGDVLGSMARTITAKYPPAARMWLQKLPGGISRDTAVQTFTAMTVGQNPEDAFALAATITDPTIRATTISDACFRWLRIDSAAATRWIQSTTLLDVQARGDLLRMAEQER